LDVLKILLRSIVTRYESNENGRFLAKLGLAKFSLEVKSKMSILSERQNYFKEKKHSLFAFLLGPSYVYGKDERSSLC